MFFANPTYIKNSFIHGKTKLSAMNETLRNDYYLKFKRYRKRELAFYRFTFNLAWCPFRHGFYYSDRFFV